MNILDFIIKHKAAAFLTGAAAGVVLTAVFADMESGDFQDLMIEKEEDIIENMSPEEYEEFMDDEEADNESIVPFKDKVIIFGKSHWKTGLAMATTFGLMILSHTAMVKELSAAVAALGVMKYKYKELDAELKRRFPEVHEKIHDYIDKKNLRKKLTETDNKYIKESSYDGRECFYERETKQKFYAKEKDVLVALDKTKERLINGGSASVYDFFKFLPKDVQRQLKIEPWMEHFGWFTGAMEETTYEYNCGYFGPYLKHIIEKKKVILNGDDFIANVIYFQFDMEEEPDMPYIIASDVENELIKIGKKRESISNIAKGENVA